MENLFSSIFSDTMDVKAFFIMITSTILTGLVISFLMSFKMHSSKRFFISNAIMPSIVAMVICFANGNIGVAVAVGGAFGLVRFRSAQGTSEEIGALFISVASGIAFGMGYIAYGVLFSILVTLIYIILTYLPIFSHKVQASYKLVKITIPEDLNYEEEFEEILKRYSSEYEYLKVKTSDMGSLYKLDIKVKMKDVKEVKEMLDEIRVRNGNMEVAALPYSEVSTQL